MQSICYVCKNKKDSSEFVPGRNKCLECNRKEGLVRYYKNKSVFHKVNDRTKQQYTQNLMRFKESIGCCLCGYNKCGVGLDFHHIDESKKEFCIAERSRKNKYSKEKINEEIQKCVLVCATCHREITHGYCNIDLSQYRITKEFTALGSKKEVARSRTNKTKDNICKCGKRISLAAKTCKNCFGKKCQKNPPITKELLTDRIKYESLEKIGKDYNCSASNVYRWCKFYGLIIPKRKNDRV